MRSVRQLYRTREKAIKQMKMLLAECVETMNEAVHGYGYSTKDKLVWDLGSISVDLAKALEHLGVKQ